MQHLNQWIIGLVMASLIAISLSGCSSDSASPLTLVDSSGSTRINLTSMRAALDALPIGELTGTEQEGIIYMREEEKLARDVYLYFHEVWGQRIFDNISNSEQTHADSMLLLVERYQLTDPVGENGPGIFADASLQQLYDELVAQGDASLIAALEVGALIEEVDLVDIERYIADIDNNEDIILVYENLMKGSRNHLRAFVRNLESQGITYAPRYLDPAEYESIINSPMEH